MNLFEFEAIPHLFLLPRHDLDWRLPPAEDGTLRHAVTCGAWPEPWQGGRLVQHMKTRQIIAHLTIKNDDLQWKMMDYIICGQTKMENDDEPWKFGWLKFWDKRHMIRTMFTPMPLQAVWTFNCLVERNPLVGVAAYRLERGIILMILRHHESK